ncbi:TPA: immunoglobulin-like domain-containing protein, partial [Enterococcus faecalis]
QLLDDAKGQGEIETNPYKLGTANITGSYTGEIVRGRLYVNDVAIATGGTFKDGQFSFYALGKVGKGDKVEMVGLDRNGYEVDKKPVSVVESIGTITPAPYKLGTANLTGSYTGDVVKGRLYVNGTAVATGGTFSNGQFTFYVVGRFTKNDKVEIAGLDRNDN